MSNWFSKFLPKKSELQILQEEMYKELLDSIENDTKISRVKDDYYHGYSYWYSAQWKSKSGILIVSKFERMIEATGSYRWEAKVEVDGQPVIHFKNGTKLLDKIKDAEANKLESQQIQTLRMKLHKLRG